MVAVAAFDAFLRERALDVKRERRLSECTTFRIGGPARWVVQPRDEGELAETVHRARECDVPIRLLGGGSNLLVGDAGFDGAVIRLHAFSRIEISDGFVFVHGGASLPRLVKETTRRGLAGLQCLAGVPGRVAGALVMNAGGRHGEIGSKVRWVDVMDPTGAMSRLSAPQAAFRYRDSDLKRWVVIAAGLELVPEDPSVVASLYADILRDKKRTQPMGTPNAGCIFKNPSGGKAGRMVESCGLKGAREGAARVSRKHANFIVNEGRALAGDVFRLIDRIRDAVRREFGVALELEVLVW